MGVGQSPAEPYFFVFEFPNPLNFTMVASLALSAVVFALVSNLALFGTPGKKDAASPVSEPGVCFTGGMDQGGWNSDAASPVSELGVRFTGGMDQGGCE